MTGAHDYTAMLCVNCGLDSSFPALVAENSAWRMRCGSCGRRTHAYLEAVDAVRAWNKGLVAISKDVREIEFMRRQGNGY